MIHQAGIVDLFKVKRGFEEYTKTCRRCQRFFKAKTRCYKICPKCRIFPTNPNAKRVKNGV